jgi:hypothetical protein
MPHSPEFNTNGAEVQHIELLPPNKDVQPLEWEQSKANMLWANWETGFSQLSIPGLAYQGCRMAVGYYTYAARGNRSNPQLARSHAIVSEWRVNDPDIAPAKEGQGRITAFFPVYDGIGFWIGKKRRDEGVSYYTPDEEIAIAQASAIGALGIGASLATPDSKDHMIYRCIWAPGKAFDADGAPIQNTTNQALSEIGLEIHEVVKLAKDQSAGPRSFRVYGDARMLRSDGDTVERQPFSPDLAKSLLPAWKHVTELLGPADPPPANSY